MRLTKERLKQIIKEELSNMREARVVDAIAGSEEDKAVATAQARRAKERDADPKKKSARKKHIDKMFSQEKDDEEEEEVDESRWRGKTFYTDKNKGVEDEPISSTSPLDKYKSRAAIAKKNLEHMLAWLEQQGQGPADDDYDFVKRKLETSKWRKWYMKQEDYDRLAALMKSDLFKSEPNILYKWAPYTTFKVG